MVPEISKLKILLIWSLNYLFNIMLFRAQYYGIKVMDHGPLDYYSDYSAMDHCGPFSHSLSTDPLFVGLARGPRLNNIFFQKILFLDFFE